MTAEKCNTIIFGRQTGHSKLTNVQNNSCVQDLCGILYECCCVLALTACWPLSFCTAGDLQPRAAASPDPDVAAGIEVTNCCCFESK